MRKLFYFSNLLTLCLILSSVSLKAQSITADPSSTTVCSGTIATFTVAASDTPSFVWQKSADGIAWDTLTNGGAYSGATSDTLHVAASASVNGLLFRAIAYNATGSDSSTSATLTVTPLAIAGTISGIGNVCVGGSATLTASVSGGAWSSTNTSIATVSAVGVVHSVAHGVDSILYTVTNSCGSTHATFVFTVDEPIDHAPIEGPSTVCTGAFVTFSPGYYGGVWTASNGHATVSSAGVVSGVTLGIDTITYTYTNACGVDVNTKEITVEGPIVPGTVSGAAILCVGSVTPFTASLPGGIWLSNDGSVATVDMASGNVTGRGHGTAIISYLFSNACGSFVATDTLQVDRAVSLITGSDSVGLGHTTVLSDTVTGGIWFSNDTTIARINATTGVVYGFDTGTTSIVYTAANACGTTSATFTIHVGLPGSAGVLTGADTVCVGGSVSLTSSVPGGVWTATNAFATVSATGIVTGVSAGMLDTIHYALDTIRYTITNGFGTSVSSKVILINQPPVIRFRDTFATINIGTAYLLHATPTGGTWVSSDDSAIIFISPNTFLPLRKRDTTYLIYTVSNSCGTSVDSFIVYLPRPDPAGVGGVQATNDLVSVFPNPNNGTFTINIASANNVAGNVTITNMVGQVVSEMSIPANQPADITLSQPAGVYFVSVTTGTGKYTTRVVVTK